MKTFLKFALPLLLWQVAALHAQTIVTNMSAGGLHSLFIKSDGSLWGMGFNSFGQLGDGTVDSKARPEEIISGGVTAIAAGANHSLFLKSNGSLWTMGDNWYGQLGDGTSSNLVETPVEIVPSGVTAIAADVNDPLSSLHHSLFVKSDGSLWAMGDNQYGELGNGTTINANTPQKIVPSGVVAIAAGSHHSLFIKSDSSLWAMGWNALGQLGDGTTNRVVVSPEQVVANGVSAVAAGSDYSLFLKSDGSLWGMGFNAYGQLGDGPFTKTNVPQKIISSGIDAIAAGGSDFILFLKSGGSLWGMGYNNDGQLGSDSFSKTNQPVEIVSNDVVRIAAGGTHSMFLKSDGSLWAMGNNSIYALGDGFTNTFSWFPEQILPTLQPVLTTRVLLARNLQLIATCQFGGTFFLLSSTNLAKPLSQWKQAGTYLVRARSTNNLTYTLYNVVNSSLPRQFYILQSQ